MMRKTKILRIFCNARALFSKELWTLDTTDASPAWKRVVKFTKIVRITLESFAENRMGFQCVALSYFITMALIPLIAVIFAVSGGLGLEGQLSGILYRLIPNDSSMIELILEKARNIIDVAQSGTVGFIAALTFIWTILWMMFQVERVFNNVWGIRKIPRKIYKRFSFYLLMVFLIPFIVLVFGSGIAFYLNLTKYIGLDLSDIRTLVELLGWLVFYIISLFTFSAMYKWLPAAKVKYKYAFKAAAFSALVFVVFQYIYLETQVFVSRMNGVYGVLAAIPLFLLWLNLSWQIIIYGAQLSYGLQNVDSYHISE